MTRIIANILLLLGHSILLFYNIKIGIIVKITGNILLINYFLKMKYYDMIVTLLAFSLLEIYRLFL